MFMWNYSELSCHFFSINKLLSIIIIIINKLFKVVQAILKDSGDTTKMSLIFANKSEDDILLRLVKLFLLIRNHPCLFYFFAWLMIAIFIEKNWMN